MGAGLIDDFIRDILSVPFCPYHFVHTILSNTILSVYHFVRYHFVRYHFVHFVLGLPKCDSSSRLAQESEDRLHMKTTAVTRIVIFFRINSFFKINFISDAFFSHEINLTRKNNIA